jgi:ParB-like chromosome segregation protein Spo0J
MNMTNKEMTEISLADIHVGEHRVRCDIGNLDDLKESVIRFGLLHPIAVKPTPDGYQLIAGERRLSVMRMLGAKRITVQVHDSLSLIDELDLELEENLRRQNLNPMDLAEALKRRKLLYESLHPETRVGSTGGGRNGSGGRTKSDLAGDGKPAVRFTKAASERFDVSETTIKEWLQLNNLPSDKKTALRIGKISKTEAIQVVREKAAQHDVKDNPKPQRSQERGEERNRLLLRAIAELDRLLKTVSPGDLTSSSIEGLCSLSAKITEIIKIARC